MTACPHKFVVENKPNNKNTRLLSAAARVFIVLLTSTYKCKYNLSNMQITYLSGVMLPVILIS
jgi:hypothetical protein